MYYDHNEFISLIKEAFKEELSEILKQKRKVMMMFIFSAKGIRIIKRFNFMHS